MDGAESRFAALIPIMRQSLPIFNAEKRATALLSPRGRPLAGVLGWPQMAYEQSSAKRFSVKRFW